MQMTLKSSSVAASSCYAEFSGMAFEFCALGNVGQARIF